MQKLQWMLFLEMLDSLKDVTATRSEIGSNINRLEHTVSNMSQMQENVDAATGRIMDVDFATEKWQHDEEPNASANRGTNAVINQKHDANGGANAWLMLSIVILG